MLILDNVIIIICVEESVPEKFYEISYIKGDNKQRIYKEIMSADDYKYLTDSFFNSFNCLSSYLW